MKIGIIGTGRIAGRFVPEALAAGNIEITAVYNPHVGSAERFAGERCKGLQVSATMDLEEFMDAVDAVYIAAPHETHYGYIMECLVHEKHVLCEKPMVLSRLQAEECFGAAAEKDLVLMEGIKTAYCPGYRKLLEIAGSGIIGDIRYIESCFTKLEDKGKREFTDTAYGGSFTELGSYVLLPILDLFGGDYETVRFSEIWGANDLDIFVKTDVAYRNYFASTLCGLGVKAEGRMMVSGTKGYILVRAPWWKTSHIEVHFEDPRRMVTYDFPFEGDGLRYEIREFTDWIKRKDDRTFAASGDRSIIMAGLMERFLRDRRSR
ncbi:MAG: Gfo/Idh/MocA family oxidoreductase [Lachnospiraceae bacterium]|nr:Gfo/Idh/MocA family oxidoreductase [Lachnospiraceae bacterium]